MSARYLSIKFCLLAVFRLDNNLNYLDLLNYSPNRIWEFTHEANYFIYYQRIIKLLEMPKCFHNDKQLLTVAFQYILKCGGVGQISYNVESVFFSFPPLWENDPLASIPVNATYTTMSAKSSP